MNDFWILDENDEPIRAKDIFECANFWIENDKRRRVAFTRIMDKHIGLIEVSTVLLYSSCVFNGPPTYETRIDVDPEAHGKMIYPGHDYMERTTSKANAEAMHHGIAMLVDKSIIQRDQYSDIAKDAADKFLNRIGESE